MTKINKYKLKHNYASSLDKFVSKLDRDEQKIVNQYGNNANGKTDTSDV